jgi:hypothetical protein
MVTKQERRKFHSPPVCKGRQPTETRGIVIARPIPAGYARRAFRNMKFRKSRGREAATCGKFRRPHGKTVATPHLHAVSVQFPF